MLLFVLVVFVVAIVVVVVAIVVVLVVENLDMKIACTVLMTVLLYLLVLGNMCWAMGELCYSADDDSPQSLWIRYINIYIQFDVMEYIVLCSTAV